jgi:spore germination cell wall hydrolase CwlJ-like protein
MTLLSDITDPSAGARGFPLSLGRLFPDANPRQLAGAFSAGLALVGFWLLQDNTRVEVTPAPSLPTRPAPPSTPAPAQVAPALPVPTQAQPSDLAVRANLDAPFSTMPNTPAKPFMLEPESAKDYLRAQTCLSMAIYYEAASQSETGQAAIAQVVINRLRHPAFPKTVCGVVFQGSTLPTGCQFTFTCDGSLARPPSADGWRTAWRIAGRALTGYVESSVGQATHYHTLWVVPDWQNTVSKVAVVGAHVFFRWRGAAGADGVLNQSYAGDEPRPAALVASAKRAETARLIAAATEPVPVDADEDPAPAADADADKPAVVAAPAVQVAQATTTLAPPAEAPALELHPVATEGFVSTTGADGPPRLAIASRW